MKLRRVRKSLVRNDGKVFLDRWGVQWRPVGGIFVHRIDAPDPGVDLHDHPWGFVSIILAGGYIEERCPVEDAVECAWAADRWPESCHQGVINTRHRWSIQRLTRAECHSIRMVFGRTWTLMLVGPQRSGGWGFYTPAGWIHEHDYDRANRRGMAAFERIGGTFRREKR